MTIACHLLQPGTRKAIPLEAVSAYIAKGQDLVWLELRGIDQDTAKHLERELHLHELAVEDALSAHQRPKVEDYPGGLFLVLRTARWWNNGIDHGETHIFCATGYLACIRHDPGPAYVAVQERLVHMGRKLSPGLALYALLDHIVDELRPLVDRLEERHASLEAMVFEEGFSQGILRHLYDTKREILKLLATVQPLPEICENLIRLHHGVVEEDLRAYYRDVEDHALRLIQALDRLRTMVGDTMQLALATASMEQSEAVQKLAGWGAIIAVPTLIFSLYGMNFENMPELQWPWGYPLVLAATASLCYWLYRYLRRRGWI
ncbi:MAG TPA: magnesium and cobalt transport protein CorA [Thiobacillaceae bacterium]|nr:magnesium and cobalt transport protein CorA [Thiobacillaceae bacterium]HNU65458.1 magnesium and cobalt transport protein CorA [Thiobacillaceae bacterium]